MSEWPPLPFGEPPADAPGLLSVSELSARIRGTLEGTFPAVVVEGEISNCRRWSSGHVYFTLKDNQAQIRAVMFRTAARQLRFEPEDGLHVVARGRVGVYEVKGEYQLICDTLAPLGLGALQAAFDRLKRTLHAEGLFDQARKRPLPALPRRIGVVTSLDGAAIRDILRVLTVRHPAAQVVVRPARVQGEGAAADLVRALRAVVRVPGVDVVIIGRGGGSAEDLWAFNDERLARALAECPVPVVAAVGHESDVTIADFVADVRAATPSNAAEIVVERADHLGSRIDRARHGLRRAAAARVARRHEQAARLDLRLRRWPVAVLMRDRDAEERFVRLREAADRRLRRETARFDGLRRRLDRRDLRRVTGELQFRLQTADARLHARVAARRAAAASRLGTLAARLDALSPLAVLGRGYAVCWNEARTGIIRSSSAVRPGDRIRVTLAAGEVGCRVEETA
jgi:exodeoxyribonuclease VII large subunit